MDELAEKEKLKQLYAQVENRKQFHESVANEFEIKPSSVRTNWFGNRFEVPEKYGIMKRLIIHTKNYIKNQNVEVA